MNRAGGSGRPPGSPNKVTMAARELMIEVGFNPIEELIKRYHDKNLEESTHNFCLKELVSRYAPSLRQTEIVGSEGATLETLIRIVAGTKTE